MGGEALEKPHHGVFGLAQVGLNRSVQVVGEDKIGTESEGALEGVLHCVVMARLLGAEFDDEAIAAAEAGP